MNYDILGLIVQKVSGQSYSSYLENQIFSPLNMHQTYVKGDTEKKVQQLKVMKSSMAKP